MNYEAAYDRRGIVCLPVSLFRTVHSDDSKSIIPVWKVCLSPRAFHSSFSSPLFSNRDGCRKERTEELLLLPRSSDRVYGAHCSSGGGSG